MFGSARIKLTLWYLLIVALITALFSVGIYKGFTQEFDRILKIQQLRNSRGLDQPSRPPGSFPDESEPRRLDTQLIEESEARIRLIIVLIDLGVLAASAVAGYFLAGRTLRPIEEMVDEQKRFTADASHELRTPLAALRSEIEVSLRDKGLTFAQAKSLLKSNLEEAVKLQAMSNELLSLSKYQGLDTKLNFKPVLIANVLEEAVLRTAPLAKKKDIKVVVISKDGEIEASSSSLVELVVTLLDNAIKFSPKGRKVQVGAKLTGNSILIEVKDEGIGIAEKELTEIFNRFYQADVSRNRDSQGVGLGLAIAKRIVELHKGVIEVSSKLGHGSTFTVKLPVKQVSALS